MSTDVEKHNGETFLAPLQQQHFATNELLTARAAALELMLSQCIGTAYTHNGCNRTAPSQSIMIPPTPTSDSHVHPGDSCRKLSTQPRTPLLIAPPQSHYGTRHVQLHEATGATSEPHENKPRQLGSCLTACRTTSHNSHNSGNWQYVSCPWPL